MIPYLWNEQPVQKLQTVIEDDHYCKQDENTNKTRIVFPDKSWRRDDASSLFIPCVFSDLDNLKKMLYICHNNLMVT